MRSWSFHSSLLKLVCDPSILAGLSREDALHIIDA